MIIKADNKKKFVVERPDKFGGNVEYDNYEDIEKDFVAKKLHPMDLKQAVAREINVLLDPIRKKFDKLKKLSDDAYKEQFYIVVFVMFDMDYEKNYDIIWTWGSLVLGIIVIFILDATGRVGE